MIGQHGTGRASVGLATGTLVMFVALMSACSGDDDASNAAGGDCPDVLCVAGAAECFGNAIWTCNADGLNWTKEGCGTLESCSEGECVSRVCLAPGKSECSDEAQGGTTCALDGMSETEFSCGADESCLEGACVAAACTDGETTCGYRAVLACDDGEWEVTPCGASMLCTEDADGARCESWACTPGTSMCVGGKAVTCDAEGRTETETQCGETEVCEGGYCLAATCDQIEAGQAGAAAGGCPELCEVIFDPETTDNDRECLAEVGPELGLEEGMQCEPEPVDAAECAACLEGLGLSAAVCGQLRMACFMPSEEGGADVVDSPEDVTGGSTEDAGPEEVAPHPELEPISRIDFKLSGIPNTFDLAAQADYQESESRMVISGSDGARKMEINLAKVEPYTVGTWSDTDDSEITAVVCYHDGTSNESPPDGAGCSVGFSHASILYSLEVLTNNGDGSRVTGTFSATLMDAMGGQLEFTEGSFDVLHK